MKAREFIRRTVVEEHRDKFRVVAVGSPGTGKSTAATRWHVHEDEELPLGVTLSLEAQDRLTIEGGRIVDTPDGMRWVKGEHPE